MVLLDQKQILAENSSKQNTTRKRYTDLGGSGGLYSKKFHDIRKVPGRNRVGEGLRGAIPIWRRGQGGARATTRGRTLVRLLRSDSIS